MSSYDRMRGLLSDRPVAFHPQLARLLGGINAALLFQQIAFWSNTKPDSEPGYGAWIWKTQTELEAETTLTRYEQENARKNLCRINVTEEHRRGVPARLHYRINWRRFFELLEEDASFAVCEKSPDKNGAASRSRTRAKREPERDEVADRIGANPQSNPESVPRDHTEMEDQPELEFPALSEAESAWVEVASSLIDAGKAPHWFRPWCKDAKLAGTTLTVHLPTSRRIGEETFADLVRSELGDELAAAWRAVSSEPKAVLKLEAR